MLLVVSLLSSDAVSGRTRTSASSTGGFMYILARQNHTSGTVQWQREYGVAGMISIPDFIHANV